MDEAFFATAGMCDIVDQFDIVDLIEVEHLLARCGFHLEHVYADYDKSPYGLKYPGELVTIAQKVAS